MTVAGNSIGGADRAGADGTARSTRERVVDAALTAFGRRGYDVTSLDAVAGELGVRKQTILYYFPSKEALLAAAVDRAAVELTEALSQLSQPPVPSVRLSQPPQASQPSRAEPEAEPAWDRVQAVVRAVFRLAARRPELLGLVREVTRRGPPATTQFATMLGPLIDRATGFLEDAMAGGQLRQQDARLLLLMAYSAVVGVATEVEVLRALGVEPTARSMVRQRRALLGFLRSALLPAER